MWWFLGFPSPRNMFSATGILWLPAFLYGFFFYFFFMTYWSIQSWISMVERNTFILFLIIEQMFSDLLMHCDVSCDTVIYIPFILIFQMMKDVIFFVLFVHRLTYHMFWSLLCWDHILCLLVSAFWTILESPDKSHDKSSCWTM